MRKEQLALKFPAGTKARLKGLALPGEIMTATILRALDRLETIPRAADSVVDGIGQDTAAVGLSARVDALEGRIAVLEGSRWDLDNQDPGPNNSDLRLDQSSQRLDESDPRSDSPDSSLDASSHYLDDSGHATPASGRGAVIERIKAMRADGKTNKAIAETLNRDDVPTFSGRGQWQAGTVSRLTREL